jgi:radical SAM superfamily enzyme YgiQ (UPF0313 family)
MAQRRHHYEQAFEGYLRAHRIPYVAVDEAKKALLPRGSAAGSLKSFDFVIYGEGANLLVEVKGRKAGRRRLESWVTLEDLASLRRWEELFGPEFQAAFVFVYWHEDQPADALFQEVFDSRGRWYALRCVRVGDYAAGMKVRSPRWRTVELPRGWFERVSAPLVTGPGGLPGLVLPAFEKLA